MLKNPMLIEKCCIPIRPLEDNHINRQAFVELKHQEHLIVGIALNVDWVSIDPLEDDLKKIYRFYKREHPESLREWIKEGLTYDPICSQYHEWLREGGAW